MYISKRYELAFWGWLGLACIFISKNNINIANLGMNKPRISSGTVEEACELNITSNSTDTGSKPEIINYDFNWTENQEMTMIGCYYYGYVATHIPAGWIGYKFGFRRLLFYASLLGAIINLVYPFLVTKNFIYGVILRILLGVAHSGSSTAMTEAWSKWAPADEKSRLLNIIYSGMTFGILTTNLVGGVIVSKFGWEMMFYIPAVVSLIWCAGWYLRVYESPEEHKTISDEEKHYIIKTRASQNNKSDSSTSAIEEVQQMLKLTGKMPFWAYSVGQIGKDFAALMAIQLLPMYMNRNSFDLKASGFFSSLPMLALTISEFGIGFLSDWLIKLINVKRTRRLLVFLGALGCSVCLFLVNFVGCNTTLAMVLLNLSMFFLGCYCVNVQSNVLDFGSQFAGRINAISNTLSNSSGIVAPMIAAVIFDNLGQSRRTWGYVFLVTTVICIGCAVFFTVFMSVKNVYETAPVSRDYPSSRDEKEEKKLFV